MENQTNTEVATTKVAKVKKEKTIKVKGEPKKRGRKPNPNSERQARLARYETKRASGVEVKRGRPAGSKGKAKAE